MRYIVKREEMQALDAYSIEEIGIPSMVLMERAAMAVTQVIMDYVKELDLNGPARVLVVTEGGNNGGDGLAAARMLYEQGCRVDICQIGGLKKVSEPYQQQKRILEKLGLSIRYGVTEEVMQEWENCRYDVVVDAVFGVGLKREIQSPQREVLEAMNQLEGFKCAVDIPSGIDSTDGALLGVAFQADATVTFGWEKTGQLFGAGPEYCGILWVADIGFPQKAVEKNKPQCYCYDWEDWMRLPVRNADGNKGTFGKTAIIAGSEAVCGAAVLSATAAYRSGCGLVEIITHVNNREAVQKLLPEALLQVYDSKEKAVQLVTEAAHWADIMVIGPGIGTDETGAAMTLQALEQDCPLVVDADAITILSRQDAWWERRRSYNTRGGRNLQMILTPHMKEMERISRIPMQQLKKRPWEGTERLTEHGVICVLKDARTVVMEPDETGCYMNLSGNDGMATGGSGDVLTGVIASLAAQGLSLGEAARLGVYLHGLGGDRAAERRGAYGMLASDIIEGVEGILKEWNIR
ncbi:MAG: NAD(P)H-hydrate dehydratase [Bacteroides sp.]|nr:NAD(P)H-hydrate dehydratase [Bacteroides sp.]MCM1548662.1 NAD(P)H-hydrate dehydratase [Clostridium sp.]